jgi:hypothetical protein
MSNKRCCPDPCNIPTGCINPLVYLLQRTLARATDGVSISTAFGQVLTAGIVISGKENFCCPDCVTESGFYYLGGISSFEKVINDKKMGVAVDNNPNIEYPCCVNKSLSLQVDTLIYNPLFKNSTLDKTPVCCPKTFGNEITYLLNETGIDPTVNLAYGAIEASSFNGVSGIKIMLDYLKSLSPEIPKDVLTSIFGLIFNHGFVVDCTGCDLIIEFIENPNI